MKERILADIPAVILVGGKGSRLGDLTKDNPKPLIEVGERSILEWQLEELSKAGVGLVVLATGYKGEDIINKILIGENYFIDVYYSHENFPLGRGGALKKALQEIQGDWKYAIVRNGDNMAPNFDFKKLLIFHCQKQALVTVSLAVRKAKDSRGYGVVDVEKDGKIKAFREKPADLVGDHEIKVNAGIYVFSREMLPLLPENGDHEKETFPGLIEKSGMYGYPIDQWFTVDTPEDLEKVRASLGIFPAS